MKRKIALITSIVISFLMVILFAYAAYNKLKIYPAFVTQLSKTPYIKNFANTLAWFIPSTEIIIVLLLLYYRTRLAGLLTSFLLMLVFTTYIIILLNFSPTIPCACGGILSKLTWKQHLYFNALCTALAAAGYYLYPKKTVQTS